MRRKLQEYLIHWKENPEEKPLLIVGARCVGKTYLALDFAGNEFQRKAYLNFENNPYAARCFHGKEPAVWKENIESYYKISLESNEDLLILDEIPDFLYLIKIKLLKEANIRAKIILISSRQFHLPEDAITKDIPKKMETLSQFIMKNFCSYTMYPMDFEEFLDALGNQWYVPVIHDYVKSQKPLPEIVHRELNRMIDRYLVVGGMPEAVQFYVETKSILDIPEIHKRILASMEYDLRYSVDELLAGKCLALYHTMDLQLAKKNKCLQCSFIRKGTTLTDYEEALQLLTRSYMLYEVPARINEARAPKLYFSDVGMLLSYTNRRNLLTEPEQKQEFAQALLQNYVLENLLQIHDRLSYWEIDHNTKVDFLFDGSPFCKEEDFVSMMEGLQKMQKEETQNKVMTGIMQCKEGKELKQSFSSGLIQRNVNFSSPKRNWNAGYPESDTPVSGKLKKQSWLLPIEVTFDEITSSKNLFELQKKFAAEWGIKLSNKNISRSKNNLYLPFYAVCCLKDKDILQQFWKSGLSAENEPVPGS